MKNKNLIKKEKPYPNKKTIKTFRKFLYRNGVVANMFFRQASESFKRQMLKDKRKVIIANWVNYAFIWNDSAEGSDFWNEIHYKWYDYVADNWLEEEKIVL